jgi:hypothetical protein
MTALMKYRQSGSRRARYLWQQPAHLHSPARIWTAMFTPESPTADNASFSRHG